MLLMMQVSSGIGPPSQTVIGQRLLAPHTAFADTGLCKRLGQDSVKLKCGKWN